MNPASKILEKQFWHFLALAGLLSGLYYYSSLHPEINRGDLWGIGTSDWLIIAILVPILHQIYVLICWRSELYFKGMTKRFGQRAFTLFKVGFAILILLRPLSITLLALANAGTAQIDKNWSTILALALCIPSVWLFYSVKTYFGIDRAFGIDHFQPEKYRSAPLVKKGIFKYTSNGMYLYGFLILWVPGLLLRSEAAILAALFNHLYIWTHFWFTEKVDMDRIYKTTTTHSMEGNDSV